MDYRDTTMNMTLDNNEKNMIIGCIEPVSFPELGLSQIMAKIDTGAYTGAIHCTDAKVVRRGMNRKRVLKFTLPDSQGEKHETEHFYKTYVRSALGHQQKRYVIHTTIEIAGKSYMTLIGLSDRSKMKYPVLIGRKFLRENNILVDVRVNAEHDDDGENMKEMN